MASEKTRWLRCGAAVLLGILMVAPVGCENQHSDVEVKEKNAKDTASDQKADDKTADDASNDQRQAIDDSENPS